MSSKVNKFWKKVKEIDPNKVKIHEGSDDFESNRYSVSILHLNKDQAELLQKEIRKLLSRKGIN